jgi:bile acid:Na+ symporter, BASS family
MVDALRFIVRLALVLFLVSSMLTIGLTLAWRAIIEPLKNLRLVLAALLVSLVLAPALACLLLAIFPLRPEHATGLLLLSLAAGAPFLPRLVQAARGDLAFTVALMALLMVGTLVCMPLGLPLLVPGMHASPWMIARPLVVFMALPMAVGMVVQGRFTGFAALCRPVAGAVSNACMAVVLVLLIGLNVRALFDVVGSGAIIVAALFSGVLFAAGYLLGGPQPKTRGVLGLASGTRNVGAALAAARIQSDPQVMVMLLVATLVGGLLLRVPARWLRRQVISAE